MGRRLIVEPTDCLIDDLISITIEDLNQYEIVELQAEMTDNFGMHWSSSVMVQANVFGEVHMAKVAPLLGSYSMPSSMGMFWSMKRDRNRDTGVKTPRQPLKTSITLRRNGAAEETVQVLRHLVHPAILREEVTENGLIGVFYHHGDKRPRPTILVLGGSEGGLRDGHAALLAAKGFNAFSLAYFGMKGLPLQLVNIPIEYFRSAIQWLQARPDVDPGRIGVIGTSKGGELALLLACYEHKIKAVVACVPSSVIHMGLGEAKKGQAPSSWSYNGHPLPYAFNQAKAKLLTSMIINQRNACQMISYREWYRMHAEAAPDDAIIPVEKINGSILVISGGDDQLWPSALFGEQVMERLKKHKFKHLFKHLSYPKAGHAIGYPGLPTTESSKFGYGAIVLEGGGTPEENYQAQEDSWKKMIDFLKLAL